MKYKIKLKVLGKLIVFIFSIITGCESSENNNFNDSAILLSYLQPNDTFVLKVGRQIPFDSLSMFSPDDIENLDITLIYNNSIFKLLHSGAGVYSNGNIHLEEDDHYSVEFMFNSKKVIAETHIPAKPSGFTLSDSIIYVDRQTENQQGQVTQVAPIDFFWINTDGSYYFLLVENVERNLDPIVSVSEGRAPKGFRKTPTNSDFDQIRGNDFTYFGKHRIILFHVQSDYAALYQQNNSTSQNLTNASSSIINGYGIFTGINSDTLYVTIKEQ